MEIWPRFVNLEQWRPESQKNNECSIYGGASDKNPMLLAEKIKAAHKFLQHIRVYNFVGTPATIAAFASRECFGYISYNSQFGAF